MKISYAVLIKFITNYVNRGLESGKMMTQMKVRKLESGYSSGSRIVVLMSLRFSIRQPLTDTEEKLLVKILESEYLKKINEM